MENFSIDDLKGDLEKTLAEAEEKHSSVNVEEPEAVEDKAE